MLEAQDMAPAGREAGARVALPGPARLGVAPVAYAAPGVTVRDRASGACQASHGTAVPFTTAEREQERRQTL